jgi:WD40 repeat protein
LRETDVAMQVWDLMLRKRVGGSLSVPSTVRWTVFSPDSRNIAVASSDGTVRVWAVENSQELTAPLKLDGDITRIEFSPDGQTLASGAVDYFVESAQRNEIKEFKAHGRVRESNFSPTDAGW